jgi:hypothetical protein
MDPALAHGLRREVRAFVTEAGRRRILPARCHVGLPGAERVVIPETPWEVALQEPGLLADLVERAVDGLVTTAGAGAWVTRTGDLEPTPTDAAWFGAARRGFARHGLPLSAFWVLNRTGWHDLVGGERRVWTRLRPLRGG